MTKLRLELGLALSFWCFSWSIGRTVPCELPSWTKRCSTPSSRRDCYQDNHHLLFREGPSTWQHQRSRSVILCFLPCPIYSSSSPGTTSIGLLVCDISRVHLPNCLHFEVDCRVHYFVEYQIRVQLGECGGLLHFEVTCQGNTLGNGEVRVDYFRNAVKNL